MDGKALLETLISLVILLFVLTALRKVIAFFCAKYGIDGVASFLS